MTITQEQYAQYRRVQDSGLYNMHDPRARALTSLNREQYIEIMENYEALRGEHEEYHKSTRTGVQAFRKDILSEDDVELAKKSLETFADVIAGDPMHYAKILMTYYTRLKECEEGERGIALYGHILKNPIQNQ
tara:strand:- start:1098 stop:1496 length:399 start_codon:yes stop_codon:yes gene_type:complete